MSDKQAQQDALRAQRAVEAYEREWRRKEKESVEKQIQLENEIRQERQKQQRAREEALLIESKKLKDSFEESLKKQKQIEERIKQEEQIKSEKNRMYAAELQAQIKQKELDRRKARSDFFMEGIKMREERKERKQKIDDIKNRKISVFPCLT